MILSLGFVAFLLVVSASTGKAPDLQDVLYVSEDYTELLEPSDPSHIFYKSTIENITKASVHQALKFTTSPSLKSKLTAIQCSENLGSFFALAHPVHKVSTKGTPVFVLDHKKSGLINRPLSRIDVARRIFTLWTHTHFTGPRLSFYFFSPHQVLLPDSRMSRMIVRPIGWPSKQELKKVLKVDLESRCKEEVLPPTHRHLKTERCPVRETSLPIPSTLLRGCASTGWTW